MWSDCRQGTRVLGIDRGDRERLANEAEARRACAPDGAAVLDCMLYALCQLRGRV